MKKPTCLSYFACPECGKKQLYRIYGEYKFMLRCWNCKTEYYADLKLKKTKKVEADARNNL